MPNAEGLMETGEVAQSAGLYLSQCCQHEITIAPGKMFPPCRKCRDRAWWKRRADAARAAES